MSPSDVRAVMDASNDSRGYAYPVFPYGGGYGGGFGGGFGNDGGWLWIILILALFGGFNGNGNGFGNGFNNDYAWLSNGQKEIMQNTTNGFNTLQLGNQLTSIHDSVNGLLTQLCNCCSDINATINSGFANAETAANARQIADMNQNFSNQLSTLNGFNSLNSALCNASAENRLSIANLNSTILAENCADRAALQEGVRDIITASQNNTQKIIDEIFRDRLDEKQDKIDALNRELLLKNLEASQVAQTAQTVDAIYNRLDTCPVRNNTSLSEELRYLLATIVDVDVDVETHLVTQ